MLDIWAWRHREIYRKAMKREAEQPFEIDWENNYFTAVQSYSRSVFWFAVSGKEPGANLFQHVRYTTCQFTPGVTAHEPYPLDLVVQEIDPSYGLASKGNPLWDTIYQHDAYAYPDPYYPGAKTQHDADYWLAHLKPPLRLRFEYPESLPPSLSVAPPGVDLRTTLTTLKWIEPGIDSAHTRDDDKPRLMNITLPMYSSFPSMLEGHDKCETRINLTRVCHGALIADARGRLAFGKKVKWDPSEGNQLWPTGRFTLLGSQEMSNIEFPFRHYNLTTTGNNRRRREVATATILVIAGFISLAAGEAGILGYTGTKLQQLTKDFNERFSKNEMRMTEMAERINRINVVLAASDRKLDRVVMSLMQREILMNERIDALRASVAHNSVTIARSLDKVLALTRTTRSVSLAQVALDKLIWEAIGRQPSARVLDSRSAYLMEINHGQVRLKKIASEVIRESHGHNETAGNLARQESAVERNWLNTSTRLHTLVDDWRSFVNQTLPPLNFSNWLQPDVQLDLNFTDFGKHLLTGVSDIANTAGEVITEIGGGIGQMLSKLLGPLAPYLWIIAAIIGLVVLLCCVRRLLPLLIRKQRHKKNSLMGHKQRQLDHIVRTGEEIASFIVHHTKHGYTPRNGN